MNNGKINTPLRELSFFQSLQKSQVFIQNYQTTLSLQTLVFLFIFCYCCTLHQQKNKKKDDISTQLCYPYDMDSNEFFFLLVA